MPEKDNELEPTEGTPPATPTGGLWGGVEKPDDSDASTDDSSD